MQGICETIPALPAQRYVYDFDELIIIDHLREYGRGASPPQQVRERPTQHEDRDGQQHDECTGRRVYVERPHRAANRRDDADGNSADEGRSEAAYQVARRSDRNHHQCADQQ